ncbi:hypothetical protein CHUAL_006472 [Chamberlinius hualienensis]
MRLYFYLLCFLLWTTAGNCAIDSLLPSTKGCSSLDETFKPGYTYSFTYNLTKNKFTELSPEDHYLKVLCDIELQAYATCQYVLHTKNCQLYKTADALHEKSSTFSKQMELYPLQYNGFESISASEKEDIALLNLKRGILSTIYSSSVYVEKGSPTKHIVKPDLQGHCNVSVSPSQDPDKNIVTSVKDFNECTLPSITLAECEAHFSANKQFDYVVCTERLSNPALKLVPISSDYTRELRFKEKSTLTGQSSSNLPNVRLTSLTYEQPTASTEDLQNNIVKLIKDFLSLSDTPIQSETFWTFRALVKNLRRTNNLATVGKGFSNNWGIYHSKYPNTKEMQIQIGHLWRDALIRCDTVACIEEFKNFVKQYTSILTDVLNDDVMNHIYLNWFETESSDPELIENIYEICQFRNQTTCYLLVAAKIHLYWKNSNDKLKISEKVRIIVEEIIEPLKHCKEPTELPSDEEVVQSLMMLHNIGQYTKIVDKNIVDRLFDCSTSESAHWTISLAAVEALEKFEADKKLYQYLLNVIKEPSLTLKHHVAGYHILVDKYAEKAADDIQLVLKSNNTDTDFKTYIYSHIKAVLRSQDPRRKELSKAFRKIVDDNPSEYFSYDSTDKCVSKYVENNVYFAPQGKNDVRGIEDSISFINDGNSIIPSSVVETVKVISDGKKYDIGKMAVYTKGVASYLISQIKLFIEGERLYLTRYPAVQNLLDKVDKNVVNNLVKIINGLSPEFKIEMLTEIDLLGEKVLFLKLPSSKLQRRSLEHTPDLFTQQMQIFELSDHAVTTAGLPLKFSLNGEFAITWKKKSDTTNDRHKEIYKSSFDLALSTAVGLRVGAGIELPGYLHFGSRYEIFGSVSGVLKSQYKAEYGPKNTAEIRWLLPENSKQVLTLYTHYVNVNGDNWTSTLTNDYKQKQCEKLYGTNFCKTQYIERHQALYHKSEILPSKDYPVALQITTAKDRQESVPNTMALSLFASDGYAKFHDLIRIKHSYNFEEDHRKLYIDSEWMPDLKLSIDLEKLYYNTENSTINVNGTLAPGYSIEFYDKEFVAISGKDLPSHVSPYLSKHEVIKRGEECRYEDEKFHFTTPIGNLTLLSAEQYFPVSYYADATLQFKFINEAIGKNVAKTFPIDTIWVDSQTIKLDAHYEEEAFLDNLEFTVPEVSAQLAFKLPKYAVVATYDTSIQSDYSQFTSLNITTAKSVDANPKELSYKFSLYEKVSEETDYEKTLMVAKASVPHLQWRFTSEEYNYKDARHALKWKLERLVNSEDNVHNAESEYSSILKNSPPSHQEIYFNFLIDSITDPKKASVVDINLGHKGLPWRPSGNINFHIDVVSWPDPQQVKYTLNLTDYNRILFGNYRYFDHSTLENRMTLVDNQNKTIFDWTKDLTISPAKKYIKYNDEFNSDVYTSKHYLKWDFSNKYSNIDLNIVTNSPVWDFLSLELKQHVSGGKETMKFRHNLADIDVEASWVDKYHKSIAVNSKTSTIPSSQWKIDCESEHYCIGVTTFRDNSDFMLYAIYQLSSGATEASLTICKNKICKDPQTDSENFVVKSVAGLIDRHTAVHTVVVARDLPFKVNDIVSQWLFKVIMTVNFNSSRQPIDEIIKHFTGRTLSETAGHLSTVAMYTLEVAMTDCSSSLGPVAAPLFRAVNSFSFDGSFQYPIIILGVIPLSELRAISKVFVERLGPYVGYSQVFDVHYMLPMKNLTTTDFSPSYKMLNYFHKATGDGEMAYFNFHNENYTRVALVIGPNVIRPFEGGLVTIDDPNCPQLLAYDIEGNFIIYKEMNWIYFVFNGVIFKLSYNSGEFYVDSKRSEMPQASWLTEVPRAYWNNQFSIERENNLVILRTKYELEVVCDVASYYCIFYTNKWKFGTFHGLLGKNKDVVEAQLPYGSFKYPSKFILTEDSSCKRIRTQSNPLATDHKKCQEFFDLVTAFSTLEKNDKIDPVPYYEKCLTHPGNYGGPRSVINAYIAASAALDVPVDFDFVFDSQCGEKEIEDEWTDKFEKKLDVVFIVDLNFNTSLRKTYSKSLTKLTSQIKQKFVQEGYTDIKFGLYGFRGHGDLHSVQQYTIDNKIWGTAESFSNNGLDHLFSVSGSQVLLESSRKSSEVLSAIELAMMSTHFHNQSARFVFLLTPEDPFDRIEFISLYDTLDELNNHKATLYTFSSYDEWPESAFGISEKKYIPTKKTAKTLKGYCSRLAKATDGLVWNLRFLANDENQKEFFNEVTSAMINRAKQYQEEEVHQMCALSPSMVAYPYVIP